MEQFEHIGIRRLGFECVEPLRLREEARVHLGHEVIDPRVEPGEIAFAGVVIAPGQVRRVPLLGRDLRGRSFPGPLGRRGAILPFPF